MSRAASRTRGPEQPAEAWFAPSADRRSLLDRAHQGDIIGALGRVSSADTGPRRSWHRRLATLAAVAGPGVVVLAADNDAGGISTYAQAARTMACGSSGSWCF